MVEDALQSPIPTRFWRCGGPYFVYGEDTYLSSSTLLAELNRIDKDIAVQEKKKLVMIKRLQIWIRKLSILLIKGLREQQFNDGKRTLHPLQ